MKSNIIIRNYKDDDYIELSKLWKETGIGGAHRGDNNEVITRTIENGGKLLILEDTGKNLIIGSSWITNDGRRLYLHHLGIKPQYRRKGYANLLTIKSLEYAKEMGLQIKLEVHQDNISAINLYKKLGFKYLGDYDVYIIRDIKSVCKKIS